MRRAEKKNWLLSYTVQKLTLNMKTLRPPKRLCLPTDAAGSRRKNWLLSYRQCRNWRWIWRHCALRNVSVYQLTRRGAEERTDSFHTDSAETDPEYGDTAPSETSLFTNRHNAISDKTRIFNNIAVRTQNLASSLFIFPCQLRIKNTNKLRAASPSWEAGQEFPHILWNPVFITVFTTTCHLSLSWAISILSTPPTDLRSILILSSHLRLGLPIAIFPSSIPNKTLHAPLLSPTRATYRSYHTDTETKTSYCGLFTSVSGAYTASTFRVQAWSKVGSLLTPV